MRAGQKARQDALNRVQWFLGEYRTAVGVVNQSKTRTALDDLVKELAARAADQHAAEVAAKSRTDQKDDLREELRLHHMQPISEIARAKLAGTPDITKFRLPARRTDDAALVAAGDTMARVAVQYRQVFLDEQLPRDFIEQLQAATDAVRNAVIQRDGARNQAHQTGDRSEQYGLSRSPSTMNPPCSYCGVELPQFPNVAGSVAPPPSSSVPGPSTGAAARAKRTDSDGNEIAPAL